MLNNNVQSEFEKFIEGPNEKLMLGVDKRICIKYSFFTQSSNQNKVIDFLSSVSKNCKGIVLEYKMIETKKKSELDNIKVSVDLIFQKLPIKQRQCFFYIAGILFQIKLALDNFKFSSLFLKPISSPSISFNLSLVNNKICNLSLNILAYVDLPVAKSPVNNNTFFIKTSTKKIAS